MRTWITTPEGLKLQIRFSSFSALTKFLAELGPVADAADHHPDCVISKAVVLDITLVTHAKNNTITEKDHALAAEIDRLLGKTTL